MKPKLLVVDDEKNTREALRRALEDYFEVFLSVNVETTRNLLQSEPMDVVLTDLRLGSESGLDVLHLCQKHSPPPPCVVMTAYGSVESAVEAIKKGAYDYVTKPLDLDRTQLLLRRAVQAVKVERENIQLRAQLDRSFGLDRILGKSEAMEKVLDQVRQVADSKASVLLEGESGTGKELVARALHGLSSRRGAPFVAVHCAALSPQLLESELFGHEKGSFTGATERRVGRFEQANGGTIFLDEIGEIDAATQVKLLRVLGERAFERVGGNRLIEVDVRLVAATHRSLEKLVREGKFREDLFFRIRVVQILLPPLRARPEDIPLLAESFRHEYGRENGKEELPFSKECMEALVAYSWPGNVRELRTAVEHGVVLAKGKFIEPGDLPMAVRRDGGSTISVHQDQSLKLDELKQSAIHAALEKSGRNISQAARALGISRRTLHRKLAEPAKKGKVRR
ncbi:MAG: sigma-54-dependent Fis family transcriptional regulator [Verrucomicrobia bacterium]|nr:sigma-54-dependent Fis family transcriptional regulator [Pseudomonadota bacterium]NBS06378.1 sigma-54-dependent Fis family transcriptional regulator [Verrucomicrobiota bacterium]NBS78926.1 sigma-54-dependent Fis family transcriptional regulator [bacterium]NBS49461.1 sigma-54-dependent Fis family transcriptional regulator [Verrucomicrobiota bacterium]NBT23452.1 sigma-54-dependent Fis family transcriptional regulator [bacterium]